MKRIGLALAAAVVAVLAGAGFWFWTSLATTEGRLELTELSAPVSVIRDARGVPTIKAASWRDAYRALGFVHAQDRLWQMEAMRRFGAGRLAELVGAPALASDKWMRTLGLYRLATSQVGGLSAEARAALDAYAGGVNAFIANDAGMLAPEFALLGHRPEPWRPADSLVWGKIMGTRLGGNWRTELLRARLAKRLPVARVNELWPRAAGHKARAAFPALAPIVAALVAEQIERTTGASNVWALAPGRTTTGGAVLANDPHLGFAAPILWYLAAVETPEGTLSGATVPGVPFTVLGHNGRLAWGITNTHSDIEDLVVERLAPGDAEAYLTPSGPMRFRTRVERIVVKDAATVELRVRESRHGPIISDLHAGVVAGVGAGEGHAVALQATYLAGGDRTPEAFYRMNHAADIDDFEAALRHFHSPQQNLVFADTAGAIRQLAPGRVPLRSAGRGGWPVSGWDGRGTWKGFAAFDDLPRLADPATGVLINANDPPPRLAGAPFLNDDWPPAFRARRIAERLATSEIADVAGSAGLQHDPVSLMARDLLPLMLNFMPLTADETWMLEKLSAWDHTMAASRVEPLLFSAWLRELNRILYADELGPLFGAYFGYRPLFVEAVLTRFPHWCDDVTSTDSEETCEAALRASLARALAWLGERHGADRGAWRWGDAHRAEFTHPLFRRVPVLGPLTTLSAPISGGNATLARAGSTIRNEDAPFVAVHGAGYRAVYDLADLAKSRFVIATGQSGNPLSPHYRDFLGLWRNGDTVAMGTGKRTLVLSPPRPD